MISWTVGASAGILGCSMGEDGCNRAEGTPGSASDRRAVSGHRSRKCARFQPSRKRRLRLRGRCRYSTKGLPGFKSARAIMSVGVACLTSAGKGPSKTPHTQALVTRVACSRFSRTVALSDRAGLGVVRNRSCQA